MPGDTQGGERPKLTRRPGACHMCRKKKVRCNGDKQCNLCKRYGLACIYEAPAGQQIAPPEAGDALNAPDESTEQINKDVNYDDMSQVANWSIPTDDMTFAANLESILMDDEHSAFHHDLWMGTTDLTPSNPPLSTATRSRNDESAITGDTQSFTQSGRDDGFNVYTNATADVFDLSVSLPEPDMPTTFPVTEKRKCDDVSAAEDEISRPRRRRRHDIDVLPSHERAALCALQVEDCDGATCTSQNSHVDALCTILSSSRLGLGRRDKAIKLVRKLLCRNNILGIPANWTDEVETMNLSGDDLENEHLPMQTLIELTQAVSRYLQGV
ncbi:hypothetical protein E8E14_010612 [Neopestalotiopsis sp. 37M]|nr:hypothetical protein E8E14_010612 [Neopestalotiopsis sp. 37M]